MRGRIGFGIGAIVAALVGGGLFVASRAGPGEALFARAVESRVGRDATAGLPDGLHVILCGTGSPLPSADRAGACTMVIAGRRMFVVDAGEGGARNLMLMGVPMGRLDRVLLTHFHSDHIDGLGPMMLLRWTGSAATTPLPVHGPPGVAAVVDGFNAAYAQDFTYRTAHHGEAIAPSAGAGLAAVSFDVPAGGRAGPVFAADGLIITAFAVPHDPVRPAVGYRFDYRGRSVVISGDTAVSPALVRAAQGADLLVHEALQPRLVRHMTKALDAAGQANAATITRDIIGYHASPEHAADAARAAGVRALVLTHIVPPVPSRLFHRAFLGDARARFSGPLTVGADGMIFTLPANSRAIGQDNLL